MSSTNTWKRCSTCKKDIGLGDIYQVCSVSGCRSRATNYVFCSVPCWDAHIPTERHRPDTAAAIEKRAPRSLEESEKLEGGKRIIVQDDKLGDDELLVVVSKVRKYVSEKSGLNTSASAYEALTVRIKRLCDRAIEEARRQGRKTVMDRDVP
jgi:hypothetical protein